MADYHVQYKKDKDDWSAKKAGASRASVRAATQADAIADANRLANNSGGGEVNIHRKDNNEIEDKNTIGKKDPNPPSRDKFAPPQMPGCQPCIATGRDGGGSEMHDIPPGSQGLESVGAEAPTL